MKFKINRRRIRQVIKTRHVSKRAKEQILFTLQLKRIVKRSGIRLDFTVDCSMLHSPATAMPRAVNIPPLDIPALTETAAMIQEKNKQWIRVRQEICKAFIDRRVLEIQEEIKKS